VSIESIVNEFGITLYVHRPTMTVSSDGKPNRTYASVAEVVAFVQPSGQSSDVLEGRMSGRTSATIYIAGSQDIRIDDELYTGTSGSVVRWRVTGTTNPGETSRAFALRHRLKMTVVDAVQVDPSLSQ
jgi:hypothetical protein